MEDDQPTLRQLSVPQEANGQRLDLFLAQQLSDVSRSRVQLLLHQGSVLIGGKLAKASHKLRGGESISILGDPQPRSWRKRFPWKSFMKTMTWRWSTSPPA
jgi:23S rRNA-/tRNA-specific pseudouridylate synthase